VIYEFICGKKAEVDTDDFNRFSVFGEIEACLHCCPDLVIAGDINNCPAFFDYYVRVTELIE